MEKFKIYNRRYLGSKYKLLEFIEKIVQEHTKKCKIFLDLFAGTGVVADYFNKKYDVVLNDLLRCNYISYECFFSDSEYSEKKVTDIIEKYNKKEAKSQLTAKEAQKRRRLEWKKRRLKLSETEKYSSLGDIGEDMAGRIINRMDPNELDYKLEIEYSKNNFFTNQYLGD